MRKLITMLLLLMVMFSISASPDGSWSIGMAAGYTNNTVLQQKGYRIDTGYENGHGFSVSVPVNYKAADFLSIESGIAYTQKNFTWMKTYRDMADTFTVSQQQINGFIEIPFSLCFSLRNGNVSATAGIGAYLGIWTHSYRTDKPYNSSTGLRGEGSDDTVSGFHSFTNADNMVESGFIFTSGLEVETGNTVLFMRGVYDISLTDLSSNYQIDRVIKHNSTFRAEAGMRFIIGGAK